VRSIQFFGIPNLSRRARDEIARRLDALDT
jgi:hypothetical protein